MAASLLRVGLFLVLMTKRSRGEKVPGAGTVPGHPIGGASGGRGRGSRSLLPSGTPGTNAACRSPGCRAAASHRETGEVTTP